MLRLSKALAYSAFLFLAGCCYNTLDLYTEFLGIEQYASYYVETPDPALCNPDYGQMLVIKWNVPNHFWDYPELHILVTVRYTNKKEEDIDFPIYQKTGRYMWKIMNEEFITKGCIATYKAVLMSGDTPLYLWNQTLWNETISIGE